MKQYIVASLFSVVTLHAMDSGISIEKFDRVRDYKTVCTLLDQEEKNLMIGGHPVDAAKEAIASKEHFETHTLLLDHKPIGFVMFSVNQTQCCGIRWGNSTGRVDLLAVDPAHRKKGHGMTLLTHAINMLRKQDVSGVDLYVNKNNATAIALYKKIGFEAQSMFPEFFFTYYILHRKQEEHA